MEILPMSSTKKIIFNEPSYETYKIQDLIKTSDDNIEIYCHQSVDLEWSFGLSLPKKVKFFISKNLRVNLIFTVQEDLNTPQHIDIDWILEPHSLLEGLYFFNQKTQSCTVNMAYHLDQGAHIDILSLNLQAAESILALTQSVFCQGAQSSAQIVCRSLVKDKAQIDIRGTLKLTQPVQASGAYQHHTLIVDGQPTVLAQPNLCIDYDDVQCSHGVTIGDIEKEVLVYLQTRGLSYLESKELLLENFLFKNQHILLTQSYRCILNSAIKNFLIR